MSQFVDNESSINSILWQMPNVVVLKDKNSIYQACSKEAAKVLYGEKNEDQIVGLTDKDMPGKSVEFADIFISRDKKVVTSGLPIVSLDINFWADNRMRALLSHKKPYRNKRDEIVGTIFNATELSGQVLASIYHMIMSDCKLDVKVSKQVSNYLIGGKYEDTKLTKKESECLFYIIRGGSTKQIASRFKRSPRTIEVHIEHLKQKFNCRTKAELIEKAIESGFLYSIPKFFLPMQPMAMELSLPTIGSIVNSEFGIDS